MPANARAQIKTKLGTHLLIMLSNRPRCVQEISLSTSAAPELSDVQAIADRMAGLVDPVQASMSEADLSASFPLTLHGGARNWNSEV